MTCRSPTLTFDSDLESSNLDDCDTFNLACLVSWKLWELSNNFVHDNVRFYPYMMLCHGVRPFCNPIIWRNFKISHLTTLLTGVHGRWKLTLMRLFPRELILDSSCCNGPWWSMFGVGEAKAALYAITWFKLEDWTLLFLKAIVYRSFIL